MTPQELVENADQRRAPPDIIHDIANVISSDGPLAARVLKVANSALFGMSEEIESISRAVTLIGTRQINSLAMAASIIDHFKDIDTGNFNAEVFWRHSLAVGCAAREIAYFINDPNPEQLFLVGILHDLGRLAMLIYASDKMALAINRSRENKESLLDSEHAIFGWDHTTAAKFLLENWKLPSLVIQPVVRHHAPGADRRALSHADEWFRY